MRKDWLFPRSFRIIGWALFIPSAILGLTELYQIGHLKFLGEFTDELAAIGVIGGLVFIAFSRLKVEDEMIQQLRLRSLHMSIYLNYLILSLSILFLYNLAFFKVLVYNMFTMLLVFIIHFSWSLYRLKLSEHTTR